MSRRGRRRSTSSARQWMWDVRHPAGRREFNELHVRIRAPGAARLKSSEDVIHSFFVPAFRLKQDLVPGKIVDAWFTPTKTGTYTLFCAQYCGTAHAQMTGRVIVLAPEEYLAWDQATGGARGAARPPSAALAADRAFYASYGCAQSVTNAADGERRALAGGHLRERRPPRGRPGRSRGRRTRFLHDAILHGPRNRRFRATRCGCPTYRGPSLGAESHDVRGPRRMILCEPQGLKPAPGVKEP